jgi:hypothetical protein
LRPAPERSDRTPTDDAVPGSGRHSSIHTSRGR